MSLQHEGAAVAVYHLITSGRPSLTGNPRQHPGRPGRVDPLLALVAGLAAGTAAFVVQLALWWLSGTPLRETVFRDIRLTAALLLGSDVLPAPGMAPEVSWEIFFAALLAHLALSLGYALLPAWWARHWPPGTTAVAGALYGLAVYLINLYGFTLLFPWFAVTRGWITLLAHLAFGIVLMQSCRIWLAKGWSPR